MSADIERLVADIEATADPATRERVRALLAAVLELHAGAVARVVDMVGAERTRELAADPAVAGVLLLHGLHPDPIDVRARRALDEARDILVKHRVSAELVDVGGDQVRVLMARAGGGACGSAVLKMIEERLVTAVPDAVAIAVDDAAALVPITRLAGQR